MPSIDDIAHASFAMLRLHGCSYPGGPAPGSSPGIAAFSGGAGGGSSGRVAVVAHSYGTFVACRLLQLYGPALHSLALLDPVCCGMFMPHVSPRPFRACLDHRCCLQCLGGQQCHNARPVGA